MGILSFDLKRLIKAFDGKEMNFFVDEDGSRVSDATARQTLANYISAGYERIPMRTEKLPDPKTIMPRNPRVEKLREKLQELRAESIRWMRAHPMLSMPRKYAVKIAVLEAEIQEAEAYEPRKLHEVIDMETLDRHGIGKAMVKMHIAGDYLTETASVLRQKLDSIGLADCSIFHLVKGIEQQSARFTAIVCHPEFAGLSDFISTDERLLDDLDIIVSKYLDEHLTLTHEIL